MPPETAVAQQQAVAAEAVSASGVMHGLLYSIHRLIAIGNTTSTIVFTTPTPFPTNTVAALHSVSTNDATGTGDGTPTPFPTTPPPTPTPGFGSNNYTDADADGIPADTTLALDTALFLTPVGNGSASGVFTTTDGNPAAADGSYRGALHFALDASAGLSFGWTKLHDDFQSTYSSTPAVSVGKFDLASSFLDVQAFTTSTSSHACESLGSWQLEYAPTAAWVPGTPLSAGTLTISGGSGYVMVDGTAGVFQISMSTTTALTLDPIFCGNTLVSSGRLQLLFGTSASASVHWTGCVPTVEGL